MAEKVQKYKSTKVKNFLSNSKKLYTMSTKKKGCILHNNPFKVKNDFEPLVGQRRQSFNEPYVQK